MLSLSTVSTLISYHHIQRCCISRLGFSLAVVYNIDANNVLVSVVIKTFGVCVCEMRCTMLVCLVLQEPHCAEESKAGKQCAKCAALSFLLGWRDRKDKRRTAEQDCAEL